MSTAQNGPFVSCETWMAAIASSACIGFTSLVPWLFNMTFFEHSKQKENVPEDGRMKFLLSFAVGAILGDIFFHLIPESYQSHIVELNESKSTARQKVGLSILAGLFMFIIVEMILEKWSHSGDTDEEDIVALDDNKKDHILRNRETKETPMPIFIKRDLSQAIESLEVLTDNNNSPIILDNNNSCWADLNTLAEVSNTDLINNNSVGFIMKEQHIRCRKTDEIEKTQNDKKLSINAIGSKLGSTLETKKINVIGDSLIEHDPKSGQTIDSAGYLSLIANGFDNFTHGLAIGASFLVGTKVGLLTTFVIIIHEIPHEICDYAILVNSGFSRWNAVKAQSSVSLFGILGTATALYVKSVQTLNAKTVWILPFSAGGFLYIALVNLLPEILDRETDTRNSLGQIACVILGIAFMASVAVI